MLFSETSPLPPSTCWRDRPVPVLSLLESRNEIFTRYFRPPASLSTSFGLVVIVVRVTQSFLEQPEVAAGQKFSPFPVPFLDSFCYSWRFRGHLAGRRFIVRRFKGLSLGGPNQDEGPAAFLHPDPVLRNWYSVLATGWLLILAFSPPPRSLF